MSNEADDRDNVENKQFVVLDAQCTYGISFNTLYSAIVKRLQEDGVIPFQGDD